MKKFVLLFIIILLFCSHVSAEQPSIDIPKAEYIDGIYIPKNLKEAWTELEKDLSADDLRKIKEISEDEMVASFHFSRGMGIRNSWGLWRGSRLAKYFNDLGIYHPDDMSGIILRTFWCHANNKPIKIEEHITYYKKFWLAHSEPLPDTFPEKNLTQIGAQNYDTPDGRFLGYIYVYGNKEFNKLWLYEYNKGWKIADDEFFKKYPHWQDYLKIHP